MAQSKENQTTFGKTKNSRLYIARNAISFDKCDEHDTEFPRRNSVQHMINDLEKSQPESSSGNTYQGASVLKGNTKTSTRNFPETNKSFDPASDRSQAQNQNVQTKTSANPSFLSKTQNSLSGHKELCNGDPNKSETQSGVNPRVSEQRIGDFSERNISSGQDPTSIRPGFLVLQPASNVRETLVKAEYLRLSKFNDITTFAGSKKMTKVSVDELDKRIEEECLPVTPIDDDLVDDCFDDIMELQSQLGSDFTCEFEGADVRINRPTLKTSKSQEKKQVSFSHHLESVFEYPAEDSFSSQLLDPECSLSNSVNPNSKTSQSSQVCSGTGSGHLGLYQPRLLEQCTIIPFYSSDVLPNGSITQQPTTIDSQRRATPVAKCTVVSSCSTEDTLWSGGNSGTELLF